jgi:threonine synthase
MMDNFLGYRCSLCGYEYAPGEVTYTCPKDRGNLDILLDYESINRRQSKEAILDSQEPSIWRYLPLLPVADPGGYGTTLHAVGWTPVYSPPRLADSLALRYLWIKDESSNPTASFKDRASALVVARARQIGAETVVTASTGNAGAALAGMAAAVDHPVVIFAPKSAPPAKIAQLLVFGATVLLVEGNYDQAVELAVKASQEFGWYCRNTGYNPFTAEGKKTASFEIWEQLINSGRFSKSGKPLAVFVSVGDGNIISGIHKGFKDLQALGWIESVPRIFGVQADGSAAIANAYTAQKETISAVSADTLADSISVDMPSDGVRALRAATQTNGAYITVCDDEILSAIAALGLSGIFAEPAGAASYAGLVKAVEQGQILPNDPVVAIVTGSGLKDVGAAMKAVEQAQVIEPTLEDVKRVLKL